MHLKNREKGLKKRVHFWDFLRILACMWVVMDHWTNGARNLSPLNSASPIWMKFLHLLCQTGWLGVDIFFILSGAVISQSALNRRLGVFATGRLLRLWPTYFLGIIFFLFSDIHQGRYSPLEIMAALSGVEYWFGFKEILGPAWTLGYEVHFYVLVGLMISFAKILNGDTYLLFLNYWLFLSVFGNILDSKLFSFLIIQEYSFYFILGGLLASLRKGIEFKKFLLSLILATLGSYRIMIERLQFNEKFLGSIHHLYLIAGLVLFVAISAVYLGALKDINLGKYFSSIVGYTAWLTYPIYLIHTTIDLLTNKFVAHSSERWIVLACNISFTLLLAIIMQSYLVPLVINFLRRPFTSIR